MPKFSASRPPLPNPPPSGEGTRKGSTKILPEEGITFDDVLLQPGFTNFKRGEVDLTTVLHPRITLTLPILSSPMDTVTEDTMAIAMAVAGGLGVIHRNLTPDKQADMVANVKRKKLLAGAAVGVGSDLEERLRALSKAKADLIVVDSGHGHSQFIIDAVKLIKKQFSHFVIVAGNIATVEGAKALIAAGADILRVGVGPGSICTTRIVTGMGVPQVTSILNAVQATKGKRVTIIADGGIKQMGDMAKALGCGAHAVMLGSMLAGHDEAPGELLTINGKVFKQYRGMGSVTAMKRGGAERYGQTRDTDKKKLIAEGVEGMVPAKGPAGDFLYQAQGSLRSALYYIGAKNLQEFHKHARFIRITGAGLRESHPHSITVTDAGGSYMR